MWENVFLLCVWAFTFAFVPFTNIYFYCRRINRYTGNMYEYSNFVDKYAIRRKLYPELYEDDEEQSDAQAENEQSDDDSVIDN